MARAGVTYHDVAKAAATIKTQGQEPTVDRVREHLGTGSKSTIAPLLKRWRSENGDVADLGGLPNDLVEALKSLHERTQHIADDRVEQAKQAFKTAKDELESDLAKAHNTIAQFTARQQDLERQAARLNEETNRQRKSLEEAQANLAKTEAQRDDAIIRVAEIKVTVNELKQENRDIRDHFEHYQQRTADERQQEREQHRTTTQMLQDQGQELKRQLTQAETTASKLLDTNSQLQNRVNELEESNAALNNEVSRQTESIRSLNRELDAAVTKIREYQDKQDQSAEQLSILALHNTAADKEVALLSQALDASKTELKVSRDKIVFLADENKVLLQEKAVIQGQFKQLQESL